MKTTFLLLFFLLMPLLICCQNEVIKLDTQVVDSPRHEVGLNVSQFFKTFFAFGDGPLVERNSQMFTYKYLLKNGHAWRTGIDALAVNIEEEFDVGTDNVLVDSRTKQAGFLLGYMFNKNVSKYFLAYLSIDALYLWANTNSERRTDGFRIQRTRQNRFALGPALGIQFFVTSKLSLSTEMSLYYRYTFRQVESASTPSVVTQFQESKFHNVNIFTPTSLYFNFRF